MYKLKLFKKSVFILIIFSVLVIFTGLLFVRNVPFEATISIVRSYDAVDTDIKEIRFLFSKAVFKKRNNMIGKSLKVSDYLEITPHINGQLYFKTRTMLRFIIERGSLKRNIRYTIKIKSSLKSYLGQRLEGKKSIVFDNDRFKLVASTIKQREHHVLLTPEFYLFFNYPIDLTKIKDKLRFEKLSRRYSRKKNKKKLFEIVPASFNESQRAVIKQRFVSKRFIPEYNLNDKKLYVYKIVLKKLEIDTRYFLEIEDSLKTTVGKLALNKSVFIEFRTYPYISLDQSFKKESDPEYDPSRYSDSIRPDDKITFTCSNKIDMSKNLIWSYISAYDKEGNKVRIRSIHKAPKSNKFTVSFMFYARKEYTIRIKKGLLDIYGQRTLNDYTYEVKTRDYSPFLNTPLPSKAIIESYGKINKFPMSYVNLNQLKIKIKAYHDIDSYLKEKPSVSREVDIEVGKLPRNRILYNYIDFNKYLNNKCGYLTMDIMPDKNTSSHDRSFKYLFTNLGISVKYSPKNILIYVTNLKTVEPVTEASVVIYNPRTKEKLLEGKTDKNGYLIISHKSDAYSKIYKRYDEELLIFAKKGDDYSILKYKSDSILDLTSSGAVSTNNIETSMKSFYGYIFTSKGLYKANEEVTIKGYVRFNDGGLLKVLANRKFKLKVDSPNGDTVVDEKITTNEFGSFDIKYKLPQDPSLGRYSITLSSLKSDRRSSYSTQIIASSFMVESYRPAKFEVNIDLGARNTLYYNNGKLPITVRGNYLNGAPMGFANVIYRLEAYSYKFMSSLDKLRAFSFSSSKYYDPLSGMDGSIDLNHKEIEFFTSETLNSKGRYERKIKCSVPFNSSARYQVTAKITDEDRIRIASTRSVVIHKGLFYIGYNLKSRMVGANKNIELSLVSSTPKNVSAGRIPVLIKIYRTSYLNVRKLSSDGTYRWISKKQISLEKKIIAVTSGDFNNIRKVYFKLRKAGNYIITFQAQDRLKNSITNYTTLTVYGGDYVSWEMRDDNIIKLERDKSLYSVGESAKILVKSPYEKVDALVTVEREGIIDKYRVKIQGSASIVSIPIKKDYAPNVFVSIMLLQGRINNQYPLSKLHDLYKPTVKIGYTILYVKRERKVLKINANTDKKTYEPGQSVSLNVKVRDYAGRGVKSELCIFAVDAGVLQLINYKTPNPFVAFYKNKHLMVKTADNRFEIMGQHKYRLKGERAGGDVGGGGAIRSSLGLSNVSIRKLFKAIAYLKEKVITDKNGNVRVKFKLPDNLTKYRIMIVGVDKKDKFGSTDKNIRVTKNLIVRPSLPHFMNYADSIKAGVVVTNNSDRAGNVDIYPTVNGVILKGDRKKRVFLRAGESKNVKFNFYAHKLGKARFQFIGVLYHPFKKYSDIVQWQIPVKMRLMETEEAASGNTVLSKKQISVEVPKNVIGNISGVEVVSSSTALSGIRNNLEYLFGYPYGCLEQKMSKVIPLLLGRELIKSYRLSVNLDYRKAVKKYLKDLYKYQDNTGGFQMWPERRFQNKSRTSPYLSTMILYVLHKAKADGYKVDDLVYRRAINFVVNYLSRNNFEFSSLSYSSGYWDATDVQALYILSELGIAKKSYIEPLLSKVRRLSVYSKAIMVQALYNMDKTGNKSLYQGLVSEILKAVKYEGKEAHFTEDPNRYDYYHDLYLSNVKTSAAVILALIQTDKSNPLIQALVKGLLRDIQRGRVRNTQDNLFVFWALLKYYRTFEKTDPRFRLKVYAGLRLVLRASFIGRTSNVQKAFLTLSALGANRETLKINIHKTGKGRVYYSIRFKYATNKKPKPQNRGFSISKSIVDKNGKLMTKGRKYKVGETYTVRLSVYVNSLRRNVVIDDPLAAGFEAINPTLARAAGNQMQDYSLDGFDRFALKYDRVCLFASKLTPGSYYFEYKFKAFTAGNFTLYPSRAEEMYFPEVFGTTGISRVEVVD